MTLKTSSLIIPANVTNLAICCWMGVLLFLLHVAVTTLKTAGSAIVSILWRSNVCGAIMARLSFDSIDHNSCWWSNM